MVKKLAKDLKEGNKVNVFGKGGIIKGIELSDIGKQGKRKARIEMDVEGEKLVIIRPEDYPFEVL